MTQQVDQPFEVPDYWFGPTDTLTDDELVHAFRDGQVLTQSLQDGQGRLEQELQRRAAERGATVIYGKGMNYEVKTENLTDWTQMPPVLEFLTPEEKTEAFKPEHTITVPAVPEHEEVVAAKWAVKGTVMKLLRRHGAEAVAKADAATFPGRTSGKLVQAEETK